MYIFPLIGAMGGGKRKNREGGGGNGGSNECGESHENCRNDDDNSYCGRNEDHSGAHKCKSCGRSF